ARLALPPYQGGPAPDSTVFLRRDADPPMEGRSDRHRRAESRQAADVLDRLRSRLQDLARAIDACVCEPRHWRHARLLTKPTAQRPSRHMCPGRERAEVERKCKVFEHPIAKGAELVAARVWHEPFDELRLPSLD